MTIMTRRVTQTVFLCRVDGNFGGVERHILSVAQHLDRSRFRPVIVSICTQGELARQARLMGIETAFIPMNRRWDLPSAALHLKELIEQESPALLHTFGLRSSLLAWWVRHWISLPWIIRVPNVNSTDYRGKLRGWISHTINNWLLRQADAAQVISPQLKDYLDSCWIRPRRTISIANGIHIPNSRDFPSRDKARSLLKIPSDSITIGSIGRLAHVKGYDILLQAFERLCADFPDAKLVLAGDGEEKHALQKWVAEHELQQSVYFIPFQEDVTPILACLDVYVCSSRSEGVPFSVLEAMAARKPIVAPRIGGIESILEHEKSALLIESSTPERLHEAISFLLKDHEQARRMAKHARDHVERYHSVEAMTRAVETMYEDVQGS